jgi:hypothetical protein
VFELGNPHRSRARPGQCRISGKLEVTSACKLPLSISITCTTSSKESQICDSLAVLVCSEIVPNSLAQDWRINNRRCTTFPGRSMAGIFDRNSDSYCLAEPYRRSQRISSHLQTGDSKTHRIRKSIRHTEWSCDPTFSLAGVSPFELSISETGFSLGLSGKRANSPNVPQQWRTNKCRSTTFPSRSQAESFD